MQTDETNETETPAEQMAEAVETATEAAVEIAEIEAARDVQIAEIHAETSQEANRSFREVIANEFVDQTNERLEQCQQNIETLRSMAEANNSQLAALVETMQLIQTKLTPVESSPPNPSESGEEGRREAVEPEASAEPPKEREKRKLHRWI